jgi:hypothetical protein
MQGALAQWAPPDLAQVAASCLKGRQSKAQGNALGTSRTNRVACKASSQKPLALC